MKKYVCVLVLLTTLNASFRDNLPYRNFEMAHNAMFPTIPQKSLMWCKMNPYKTVSDIEYGDVIIYKNYKEGVRYDFVWRVVGLPGDSVTTYMDSLWVNGKLLPRKFKEVQGRYKIYTEKSISENEYDISIDTTKLELNKIIPHFGTKQTVVVPADEVFAMGDNRIEAADCRFNGTVPFSVIFGKFTSVYWRGKPNIQ